MHNIGFALLGVDLLSARSFNLHLKFFNKTSIAGQRFSNFHHWQFFVMSTLQDTLIHEDYNVELQYGLQKKGTTYSDT